MNGMLKMRRHVCLVGVCARTQSDGAVFRSLPAGNAWGRGGSPDYPITTQCVVTYSSVLGVWLAVCLLCEGCTSLLVSSLHAPRGGT